MNYKKSFWDKITKYNGATVLLGGNRDIGVTEYEKLIHTGKSLASLLPASTFRSGNAPGSDDAFIKGVSEVEGSHIELTLPFSNHRRKNIPPNTSLISLNDLSFEELQEIKDIGIKSNPHRVSLLKLYQPGSKNILSIQASFLMRNILMVTGLPIQGFQPAGVAMFHVKHQKTLSSGTIFTINICRYLGVHFFTQDDYLQ